MFIFAQLSSSSLVTFTSSVQLKGVYTKNRLGVVIQKNMYNNEPPLVYTSRPPYDDGWYWTVEPDEENVSMAREPVPCGSTIVLSSPTTELYLSAKVKSGVSMAAAVTHKSEPADQWILECKNNATVWNEAEEVLFQNIKYKCYLASSLADRIPEQENKFAVKCSPLSSDAVWKVSEGIFFPKETPFVEKPKNDDEYDYDDDEL